MILSVRRSQVCIKQLIQVVFFVKDVQCNEIFGGIAHKNHAFSFFNCTVVFSRVLCFVT